MICMNKFLRFSLVSLLMTFCGLLSAQVVTFDATVDKGQSASASADQITKDGVTISITNGILGNGQQYRVYKNQTITVASTVGNIKKIEFTCTAKGDAQYGPGNFTNATTGTYTFDDVVGTWTGDAAEVSLTATTAQVRMTMVTVYLGEVQKTLTISGTTPFSSTTTVTITPSNEDYAVYYTTDGSNPAVSGQIYTGPFTLSETTTVKAVEEDYAGEMSQVVEKTFVKESTDFPVAADIAAFKALGTDTEAKLLLNNAQVLFVGTNDVYVRDASGALDLFKVGIEFSNGQILNGSITGRFALYNNLPEMAKTENTNSENITFASGTAEPKTVTIAQAKSETYYCDLIKIEGVKITAREEGTYTNYYAYIGADEIQIYDRFQVGLEYTDDGTYDVEGILVPWKGGYEIYLTQPVTSGTEPGPGIDLPKAANIAAFKALEDKTEAELTLNNAVVLYVGANDVYVRDESGAIDFYRTGLNFVAGQVMNGTITGISTNYNGLPELTKSENTNSNGYTSAAGSAVAKTVTIAEAKSEALYCDLLKIEGVKIQAREEGDFTNIYAYIGDDAIQIYDRFQVGMEYNEEDTYTVEGILVPFKGNFEIYLTKALSGEVGPQIPVCESIAAFKALEVGTEAELKLTDAVVLYAKDRDVFVRDASGAIEFYNTGIEFENNQVLNGSIIGKFSPYQGLPELAKTEGTNADGFTATAGSEPQPVVVTIPQVGESLLCDLVVLENVTFNTEEANTFAYSGDDKLQLFDKFKIFDEQLRIGETGNVTGIVIIYKGAYQLYPIRFDYSEGIHEMNTTAVNPDAPMYNLSGQAVGQGYKGLVIQDGKKMFKK